MKRVTHSWTLPCTAERYWQVFLDEEYSRALYLEGMGFRSFRVIATEPSARRLHLSPKLNLPGPVAKLVGDSFAYEQHGTIDRAASLWSWKMVQPGDTKGKGGLVSSSGTIHVVDSGEGQCRRTDEVTVSSSVFGLGGLIEASVEKELHKAWEQEIAFLRRWLVERSA